MRRTRSVLLVLVGILFLLIPLTRAGTTHFVEDFFTTDYRDSGGTSAWWDTGTGELKLQPLNVSVVGSYITAGSALGVAVDGDHAYLADGGEGLQVFDITGHTPGPAWVGQYDTPGSAWAVVAAGAHAYVADEGAGLQVIDVSTPASPSLAGSYDTPGLAYDLKIAGGHAFVADGGSGLRVIDVSDPTAPVSVGSYDTPGSAISIDVEGDIAFIADRGNGLVVVDISYLPHPTLLDMYDTPGDCWGVAVSGDFVYLGDALQGIHVVDVSNPVDVSYVTTIDPAGSHRRLFVDGDCLYASSYGSFYTIDISDPSLPSLVGSYSTINIATTAVVDGEYAYVACGSGGGLKVVDVADAFRPVRIGGFDTAPNVVKSVVVKGDYAYITESGASRAFRVLDARYPDGFSELGSYSINGIDVDVSGDYAFVVAGWEGLDVIDVSSPSTPVLHGSYSTTGSAQGVEVTGDLAYVAQGYSGLAVIDVTDPASPTELGSYVTSSSSTALDVKGNVAYLCVGQHGLAIVDVTASSSPVLLGSYDTDGDAEDVVVAGDYAFVADRYEGMAIIDVSDPTSPAQVAKVITDWNAMAVAVAGNYAFVGDGSAVRRLDIEDPTSPQTIEKSEVGGDVYGLWVEGDILFAGASGKLASMRIFSQHFTKFNTARSLPINDTADKVVRVRLAPTQIDSVQWEVSTDGGGHFGVVEPGMWEQVRYAGSSLIWRSTHYPRMNANPKCSQLVADWLFDHAMIDSISDVAGDNGGWLNLRIVRSGYDFAGTDGGPIEEYVVWRRYQDVGTGVVPAPAHTGPQSVDLPPGLWEPVDTFTAAQQHFYSVTVPTGVDEGEPGAEPSVFVVSAHRGSSSFTSAPDSGYSLDNTPPSLPTGIIVDYYYGSGNTLTWDPCPDSDFHYFWVYRGSTEDFYPWPENRVGNTTMTHFFDPRAGGPFVYYKVSAVDRSGNEGPVGSPDVLNGAGPGGVPKRFALYPAAPNPFNPGTWIRYDVPAGGGAMSIKVYNVAGRLVRTLVDGTETAARHRVEWDGRDDRGSRVASGVYLCRMKGPGFEKTYKLVLAK